MPIEIEPTEAHKLKAMRGWVRDRVRELAAVTALDEQLDEAGTLNGILAAKRAEIADAERVLAETAKQIEARNEEAAQIVGRAKTEADALIATARGVRDEAGQAHRAAQAVLADAKTQAEKIIADAEAESTRVSTAAAAFAASLKPARAAERRT